MLLDFIYSTQGVAKVYPRCSQGQKAEDITLGCDGNARQEYGYYGLVFCEAEGKDADADALYVFESVGAGDEGGTSGTDIVDE